MPISVPLLPTNNFTIAIHKHLVWERAGIYLYYFYFIYFVFCFYFFGFNTTDWALVMHTYRYVEDPLGRALTLNRAQHRRFAWVTNAQGSTFYESPVVAALKHTCWASIKLSIWITFLFFSSFLLLTFSSFFFWFWRESTWIVKYFDQHYIPFFG